jgi:hypothetical protein
VVKNNCKIEANKGQSRGKIQSRERGQMKGTSNKGNSRKRSSGKRGKGI